MPDERMSPEQLEEILQQCICPADTSLPWRSDCRVHGIDRFYRDGEEHGS